MNTTNRAHLALCANCGTHGCIVFSDGSTSDEFRFVEQFDRAVIQAVINKKICEAEVDPLFIQIARSKVPSHNFLAGVFSVLDEFYVLGAMEKSAAECPCEIGRH